MKKVCILIALCAVVLSFSDCTPKMFNGVSGASDSSTIAAIKSKYTSEDLDKGMLIFKSSCKQCHKLKMPETQTIHQWEKILPKMIKKAKLNDADAHLVGAYVFSNAKQTH